MSEFEVSSLENSSSCDYTNPYDSPLIIKSCEFNQIVQKLRDFFTKLGYVEVHTQNRLSILAACEDPFTVSTFQYVNETWPLPQTGQMWLEYELLKNPSVPGYFCVSTSYRNEPNPVPGRHNLIFPMFEFEMKGGMDELIQMEKDLLTHLGYDASKFISGKYLDIAAEYGTKELENDHETLLYKEKTPTFFLTDFPEFTSPFWNMKRHDDPNEGTANKIDVIMSGQETIGSAERETDIEIMRNRFMTIMEGGYKNKMYELFGEERTMSELKDFMKFDFFKRSGGGIGVTRLIRSMKLEGLM
jgi:aspartyl/asparaginyl-tRNA synthetase